MITVDPNQRFRGTIAIIAPHMDDEALACAGLVEKLDSKEIVHVIYATDGMMSPAPVLSRDGPVPRGLGQLRALEAKEAMTKLGVPSDNLHFLGFPEANLGAHRKRLQDVLLNRLRALDPDHLFVPFRFDRHPDHLVINQIVTDAHKRGAFDSEILEYFVYYRWRLLPSGDVRTYIRPESLLQVNIDRKSTAKREILDLYASQTTRYYPWQTRPILKSELLDEVSNNPELFLVYDESLSGLEVFTRARLWIRIVHVLEPIIQRWRYRLSVLMASLLMKNDPHTS